MRLRVVFWESLKLLAKGYSFIWGEFSHLIELIKGTKTLEKVNDH